MENFVSIVLITTFVFLAVHVLHSLLTTHWTLLSSVDPHCMNYGLLKCSPLNWQLDAEH